MKKITSAIVCILLIIIIFEFKGELAQESTVSKIDQIVNPQLKPKNLNDRIVTLKPSIIQKSNLIVPEFKLNKKKVSICNGYINAKEVTFDNYMNFLNESCNHMITLNSQNNNEYLDWLSFYSKAHEGFHLLTIKQKSMVFTLIEAQLLSPTSAIQISILNSIAIDLLKDLGDPRHFELASLNKDIESDLEYIQNKYGAKSKHSKELLSDAHKEERDFVLFFKNQFNQIMHK